MAAPGTITTTMREIDIMWRTTLMDAGDGSGDGIVELPDELLAQLGWKIGDTLTISKTDSGELLLRPTND